MKHCVLYFVILLFFFCCTKEKTIIQNNDKSTSKDSSASNSIKEQKENKSDSTVVVVKNNESFEFKKIVIDLDDEIKEKEIPMDIIWDGRTNPDKNSLNIPQNKEEFINCISTLVNENESRFLALDAEKNRLISFNNKGKFLRIIGRTGSGPGEFMYPRALAARNNFIYIFDMGNLRIQKLSMEGRFVKQIKNIRIENEYFAISNNEEIVTQAKYGSKYLLAIYDTNGNLTKEYGEYINYGKTDRINYGYNTCQLIIDKNNGVWCIFRSFPIIRKYDFDGNLLLELEFKGEIVNSFYEGFEIVKKQSTETMIISKNFFWSVGILSNYNLIITISKNLFYEINTKDGNYYLKYRYKPTGLPNELFDFYLYNFIKDDKLYLYSRYNGNSFICREK